MNEIECPVCGCIAHEKPNGVWWEDEEFRCLECGVALIVRLEEDGDVWVTEIDR